MNGYVLSADADFDLDAIWEYIAADNIAAADRWVGKPSTLYPVLFWPVGSYLIIYRAERRQIEIVAGDPRLTRHPCVPESAREPPIAFAEASHPPIACPLVSWQCSRSKPRTNSKEPADNCVACSLLSGISDPHRSFRAILTGSYPGTYERAWMRLELFMPGSFDTLSPSRRQFGVSGSGVSQKRRFTGALLPLTSKPQNSRDADDHTALAAVSLPSLIEASNFCRTRLNEINWLQRQLPVHVLPRSSVFRFCG